MVAQEGGPFEKDKCREGSEEGWPGKLALCYLLFFILLLGYYHAFISITMRKYPDQKQL